MNTFKAAVAALLFVALGGCTSLRPVPQTLNSNGPVSSDSGIGPFTVFRASYKTAFEKNYRAAQDGKVDVDGEDSSTYRRMAMDGFAAVDSNCADFFEKAGEEEKWLNFGLDAVPVVGGIATGILALTNPGAAIPGAIVILITTTATSSVKAYQKDFLFAPENIADVRGLVEDALDKHYKSLFEPPKTAQITWNFANAGSAVREHQGICRASNMLSLVTQSIKKSSTQSTSEKDPAPAAAASTAAKSAAATPVKATVSATASTATTSTHKDVKVIQTRD